MRNLVSALESAGVIGSSIYVPYSPADTTILYGVPPAPLTEWDYVWCRHINPQSKRFSSLTGSAVFVNNLNMAGVVEVGVLPGSISAGGIEALELVGIPYPISAVDSASGGSSGFVASACRRVETPEWRREMTPGLVIYTWETARLIINWGIRLPQP